MIKLTEQLLIAEKREVHYKLDFNGNEIWVNKWHEIDNELAMTDGDTEIIKGIELLSEEEQEEIIEFVNDFLK